MRPMLSFCLSVLTNATLLLVLTGSANAEPPKLKGTDLVCNGESFFEMSIICKELTRLARADGVLPANESFKQIAKSGYSISQILGLYKSCTPKPKYLVSDGGGIDLMNGSCSDENCSVIKSCKSTLLQYLDEMKKGGTKKVLWMVYPDPVKQYATSNLKKNQDIWAVVVPPIINALTEPKGLVVDLRPVWQGHYDQYTTDGIHCSDAGGTATAEAFWKAMKADNWAFFDTGSTSTNELGNSAKTAKFPLKSINAKNGNVVVSLVLEKPSKVDFQMTTISGRSVFGTQKQINISGMQTMEIPVGNLAHGIYCCAVRVEKVVTNSQVVIP